MALLGPNGEELAAKAAPSPQNAEAVPPPPPTRVVTAFLVYQTPNGQWFASDDLAAAIIPARKPVPDDLIAGSANIQAQVAGRRTADMAAKATVQTQMALARQMQSQQLSPEEAAALAAAQRRG